MYERFKLRNENLVGHREATAKGALLCSVCSACFLPHSRFLLCVAQYSTVVV